MQKIIRNYGVIILLYVVVIAGITMLSSRLRYLNSLNDSTSNNVVITNR